MNQLELNEPTPVSGEQLATARAAMGWTVDQVARQICAPVALVLALEANKQGSYPALHWLSFGKRYASLVGISASIKVQPDVPVAPLKTQGTFMASRRRVRLQRTKSSSWLRRLSAMFALVALVYLGSQQLPNFPNTHLEDSEVASPLGEFRRLTLNAPISLINDLPNNLEPTVEGVDERLVSLDEPADFLSSPVESDRSDRFESAYEILEVRLRLLDDSWVELVDASGESLVSDLLRASSEYSFKGKPPFDLFVGIASAVEITLNGQAVRHLAASPMSTPDMSTVAPQGDPVGLMRLQLLADGSVERQR